MVGESESKKVERKIRWNVKTDTGEQEIMRHRWWFLIINELREIERIEQKIYDQIQTIDDLMIIDRGRIEKSKGLHYVVINFLSHKGPFSKSRPFEISVYDGDMKRDRDLYQREKDDALFEYIQRQLGKSS